MLFSVVPKSQILYDPNKDPLWPYIEVAASEQCFLLLMSLPP